MTEKETLQEYTVQGKRVLLHPSCEAGFRADRDAGLIYGLYRITDPSTGKQRYAQNAEEASLVSKFCPYCGQA